MTKKPKKTARESCCEQVPASGVMPELPKKFDTFPFMYASLQCQWMYWYTSIEQAERYVENTGLCVARFPVETESGKTEERAVILLNFQRYTAHYDNSLGTTNEVEFNLLAYPANRKGGVPKMPLWEYLYGRDQTKTIGHLRLHVAADNRVAVEAGRAVFGEPKFYGVFNYVVPSLNAAMTAQEPPTTKQAWRIELINPDDPDTFVYRLRSDFTGYNWTKTNCTPIPEFATGLGRTIWTRWTIVGLFDTVMLSPAQARKIRLEIGDNDFAMTKDMRALFSDMQPAAVQIFESPPACIEPRGFYMDAIDRDRHDDQA
ncbi:hypothetical protein QKW60_12380 [Defluviimonas aestuarii]|uniref:hypothetical protein n=1 Tax=Albidovulum aestuarii TaxID=1130726 RepID=UPI00249A9785|nr:hypothetical protein [Defluviimonas aestuarii]MDI3337207.1 hypothetical protein [Defluviimonas aestuarii]